MEAANPGIELGAIRRRDRGSHSGPGPEVNAGPSTKRKRRSEAHDVSEANGDPSPQQGTSSNPDSGPSTTDPTGQTDLKDNGIDGAFKVSARPSSVANGMVNDCGLDILDEYAYLFPDLQNPQSSTGPGPGASQPDVNPLFTPYALNMAGPAVNSLQFAGSQAQAYQIPHSTGSLGNWMRPSTFMPGAELYNNTSQPGVAVPAAGYMTGFGLTLPPSQPISSFAGGRGESGDDYAARHPPEPPRHNSGSPNPANGQSRVGNQHTQKGSPLRNSISGQGITSNPSSTSSSAPHDTVRKSNSTPIPPVHPPEIVEEMEKQRRLREAVAKLSAGTSKRENEDMTPAEVAERAIVHAELQKAMRENHMDERAAEAMQLTMYHISK